MRLTALQLPARWNQATAQLAFTESLLEGGPATDLVLLPEASLTGYVSPARDFNLAPFAEPLDGPTRAAYAHLAARFDCLVVGPLIEKEADRRFNALIGVTPGGETLLHYRKHHPWFPETWATAGDGWCPVVEWRGVALSAAICFDLHFLLEAPFEHGELLLFSSAWVDETDTRTPLLQQLAVRERVSILNANWGRGEVVVPGQGGSVHVGANGALQRLATNTFRLDVEHAP